MDLLYQFANCLDYQKVYLYTELIGHFWGTVDVDQYSIDGTMVSC